MVDAAQIQTKQSLGFTKSVTNYQNCGKCGVHESVEGVEPDNPGLTQNISLLCFSLYPFLFLDP